MGTRFLSITPIQTYEKKKEQENYPIGRKGHVHVSTLLTLKFQRVRLTDEKASLNYAVEKR